MDKLPQAAQGSPAPSMRWFFFGLSGRIGRAPYILGTLLQIAIFAILFTQILAFPEDSVQFTYWSLVFFAYALVFVWIMVAMSVKRLHDMEIPGAVVLCLFVPVVSIIAFLVMCVWKGTDGPNDYGNDFNRPKT